MRKYFPALLLLLTVVVILPSCSGNPAIPVTASIDFYREPVADHSGTEPVILFSSDLSEEDTKMLKKAISHIKKWTDDAVCNRTEFYIVGEIHFSDAEHTYFFTAEGIVYYDHYFGQLGEEATAFLNDLRSRS